MNDDPVNNENNEKKKSIERQRQGALIQKTEDLLMADETMVSEFDKDEDGNPIYELRLIVDSPDVSTLHRLGYGQIQFSHVPEADDVLAVTTVTALHLDKETELKMFALRKDRDGNPIITTESDELDLVGINPEAGYITDDLEDPDAKFNLRPSERRITMQEELELQSILDACRDHVTIPGE